MKPDPKDTTLSKLDTERGEVPERRDVEGCLLLYHRDGAKVVPLPRGKGVVVGRAWPADAVVRDIKLSRRHAQFLWGDEGITVEDLGSTNGTHVQGTAIQKASLRSGDVVTMGSVTVVIQLLAPSDETPKGALGYDEFASRLDQEIVRSKTFSRPLTLLMLSSVDRSVHVRHLMGHLKTVVRPVDVLAVYGPGALIAYFPERQGDHVISMAQQLVKNAEVGLVAGLAMWPEHATSAGRLVARSWEALKSANPSQPVVFAEKRQSLVPQVDKVVIRSPATQKLYETVSRVAPTMAPVLIYGETGTGKELVAQAVHAQSGRRGQLLCVNCGALPATLLEATLFGHERGAFTGADRRRPGIFEQAHGGTVFLDEIGELTAEAQAVLLRVLETKKLRRVGGAEEISVDGRVVAATHRDLAAMCESGQFRLDLFYRLNTVTLHVPPLRSRNEEVAPLAELFASEAAQTSGLPHKVLDEGALTALQRYGWPGNVRELRNAIERAVVISEGLTIAVEDLPEQLRAAEPKLTAAPTQDPPLVDASFKERVIQYETDLILRALDHAQGNQTQAAKMLQMPLRTLVHKIRAYGIKKKFE